MSDLPWAYSDPIDALGNEHDEPIIEPEVRSWSLEFKDGGAWIDGYLFVPSDWDDWRQDAYVIHMAPALLVQCRHYEELLTILIDETDCYAGNPDGGSSASCEHCQYYQAREEIRKVIAKATGES